MKTLLFLSIFSASAGEIIDLGTITSRRAIVLMKNTDRPDWHHFKLELLSLSPTSNHVVLILTNNLLTLSNLVGLPSGSVVAGLESVTADGMVSPTTKLYKLDIRRAEPPEPGMEMIEFNAETNTTTIHQAIEQHHKLRRISPPPVPGQTNKPEGRELPGGKQKTYAQHQDELAEAQRMKR